MLKKLQAAVTRKYWRRAKVVTIAGLASVALWLAGSHLMLVMARSNLRERQAQKALYWIEWFETVSSPSGESRFLGARCHRRLGCMTLARQWLDAAARLGFPRESITREQWLILAQIGAIREVEPHLQSLLVAPGNDAAEICEAFVSGFLANYQFGKAIGLLDAWQADFPEDAQPWFIRGKCLKHLANPSDAAEAFGRSLALDPARDDIRKLLVETQLELHLYDEAQNQASVLLQNRPDDPDVLALQGEILRQTARTDEAESYYRRALMLSPQHHQALVGLIRVLLSVEDATEANALAKELVLARSHDSEAGFLLQQSLRMAGRDQEARDVAVRCEELLREQERARLLMEKVREQPNDPDLRFQIGSILVEHGERDDAMAWLRSVLELAPQHEQARAALLRLAK